MKIFNRHKYKILNSGIAISLLSALSCPVFGMEPEEDVVIVGGGMSGLTAAYELQKHGIKSTLYEGRDRLGGRTHTHYFNKEKTAYFEEGGTKLDSDHNAAIALAEELGVKLIKNGYGSRKISVVYKNELHDQRKLIGGLNKITSELAPLSKTIKRSKYNSEHREFWAKPLTQALSNLDDMSKNFLQTYYEDECGVSLDKAPLTNIGFITEELEEYQGLLEKRLSPFIPNFVIDQLGYNYTVKGGMSCFIDSIEKKLTNNTKINLDHILTRIEKNDKYILTFNQNGFEKKVRAEHVIMTLPFSTLRHVTIDDSVGLSTFQRKAIQNLSYGTNSKIGLPTIAKNDIYDDMLLYINLDDHFNGWPGNNAVTFMINAEEGKNLTEEKAFQICKAQEEYLNKEYPYIKGFEKPVIKNWSQDPFSLGSYSARIADEDTAFEYRSSKKGLEDVRQYAEPLDNNRFLFAGEHTRADSTSGFIEGAIRSGYKAAELLRFHTEKYGSVRSFV